MFLLLASIAALAVGPLSHRFATRQSPARAGIDGFTFVAMVGLIVVHVVPEAVEQAGSWALLLALLGVFGPTLFESFLGTLGGAAHRIALLLGVLGLLLHAALDGVAIEIGGTALGLAVVLHRVADGMTIWWLLAPSRGNRTAAWMIGLMGVSTVAGFAFAETLEGRISGPTAGMLQALVGGALLHVVLHRVRVREEGGAAARRRLAEGIGGILGVLLVAFLLGEAHADHGHEAGHDHESFGAVFMSLALESAPALAGAFLLSGLIQVFLPKATAAWLGRGGSLSQSLRGVAFGLPLPICSCGVIPVYRSIVAQGAPLSASLAFLVATPELGIDAVLLSGPLLGVEMAIIRVAGAFAVALLVGLAVGGRFGGSPRVAIEVPPEAGPTGFGARLQRAIRLSAGDLFDSTAPWIVVGLVIAAMLAPIVEPTAFAHLPSLMQVPLFALLGMPVYVCASGATPLVAVFLAKGVTPGAALAFLLTGPATNATTFGLLARLHGRRVAVAFASTIAVSTIVLGWGVDHFMDPKPAGVLAGPGGEHVHSDPGSPLAWTALAILAAMLFASILRQGARGFVARVFSWTEDGRGTPDCCAEPVAAGGSGEVAHSHRPHSCCDD